MPSAVPFVKTNIPNNKQKKSLNKRWEKLTIQIGKSKTGQHTNIKHWLSIMNLIATRSTHIGNKWIKRHKKEKKNGNN